MRRILRALRAWGTSGKRNSVLPNPREWSETCVPKGSCRSESCSKGQRPFKVRHNKVFHYFRTEKFLKKVIARSKKTQNEIPYQNEKNDPPKCSKSIQTFQKLAKTFQTTSQNLAQTRPRPLQNASKIQFFIEIIAMS